MTNLIKLQYFSKNTNGFSLEDIKASSLKDSSQGYLFDTDSSENNKLTLISTNSNYYFLIEDSK